MDLLMRIGIARCTYQQTVEKVRRDQTPATWARLLRAAKNLRDAIAEAKKLGRLPPGGQHA